MWDFSFEIPMIILMAILMAVYFSQERLDTLQTRVYIHCIFFSLLCAVFNYLSAWMDIRFMQYTSTQLWLINAGY